MAKQKLKIKNVPGSTAKEFNGKKYYKETNSGYWREGKSNGGYLHKDNWEYHNGKVPKTHDVHHKNQNKDDNRLSNLALTDKKTHGKKHGAQSKPYTKKKRPTK